MDLKCGSVIIERSIEQKISHLFFIDLADWTSWSWARSWIRLLRTTILRQLFIEVANFYFVWIAENIWYYSREYQWGTKSVEPDCVDQY